jgi:hypothetical protein
MIGMSSPRLATTRPVRPMAWMVALDGRSVSRIAERGSTIISPPNSTSMPSSTARVSGRAMVNVVPVTSGRLYRDASAKRLDLAAHDIEPDATPGKCRYFVLRREPGREKEIVDLRWAQRCRRRDESLFFGDLTNLLAVDAGTIVGHLDDHAARPMRGRKGDGAGLRLAIFAAIGSVFEAVVNRVSDHVGERIDKPLDHGLVDLRCLTHRDQPNLFSRSVRRLADNPVHPLEDRLQRLRADGHDAFLDARGQLLDAIQTIGHITVGGEARAFDGLGQHSLHDDEFADQVDETVHAVEVHPDRRRGRGTR